MRAMPTDNTDESQFLIHLRPHNLLTAKPAGGVGAYYVGTPVLHHRHCPHNGTVSVRPSPAAGLLLWARRTGGIDRLLQQQRASDECG